MRITFHVPFIGELSIARDWWMCLFFVFLISTTPIYHALVVRPFIQHLPTTSVGVASFFHFIGIQWTWVFAIISLFWLLVTVFCDPGIVDTPPPQPMAAAQLQQPFDRRATDCIPQPQQDYNQRGGAPQQPQQQGISGSTTMNQGPAVYGGYYPNRPILPCDVVSDGERDEHFCPICHVIIEGFDHHCGVIGACIGRHTMLPFIIFLCCNSALCLVAAVPAVARFFQVLTDISTREANELMKPVFFIIASLYGGGFTATLGLHYMCSVAQGHHSYHRRRVLFSKRYDTLSPFERAARLIRVRYCSCRKETNCANFKESILLLRKLRLARRRSSQTSSDMDPLCALAAAAGGPGGGLEQPA